MLKKGGKNLLFLGLATTIAFMTTACGATGDNNTSGSVDNANTAGKDQLVVANGGDPNSLDLHATNDSPSAVVTTHIFETLVNQDEEMNIIPGLAESWEMVDDRTIEFHLKEDAYFHNGEKLTAHDVAFTFERAVNSPEVAVILGEIDPESINVIDEYIIQIATYEPFAPIFAHLAHPASGIMNQKAVEEAGSAVGQNPVGTGPFQFVDWLQSDRIELERFEDYHGELPQYKELIIRSITETSSRLIELETGGIDIALQVSPSDRERIESDENLELLTGPTFQTNYMGINSQHEYLSNPLVRQAINYAIDVDLILETVMEGAGEIARGPIGGNVFGATDDLPLYDYDLERARELMAEAGLEDGFTAEIATNDNPDRVQLATVIANQLREIGIEAQPKIVEWGAYLEGLSNGEFDMHMMGWSSVTGDADYGLYPLFHSSVPAAGGNRTFYANERVDELLDAARATTDREDRLAYYEEAQQIIVEDAPWLFLTIREEAVGKRDNVRGFKINPVGHHRFINVYFE